MTVDIYHHRRRLLVTVIVLLSALLAVLIFAMAFGEGFDPASRDPLIGVVLSVLLALPIAACVWVLRKRPRALVISAEGIDIPLAFRRPLRWDEVHRIRRIRTKGGLYGPRDWLIIDPSPGVLPPVRFRLWRKLELRWQKFFGVRIPLHGLEAPGDVIVRSVERFRPVSEAPE
ncbi:MAG: hypothetical protein JXR14_09565 [Paracoccaceae bacterium]